MESAEGRAPEAVGDLAEELRRRTAAAGVPEDHVDSMVDKWVKAAVACDGKKGEELAECYKTASNCHRGSTGKDGWQDVDWEVVKAAKTGFLERAKAARSAEEIRPLASGLRARLVEGGKVPEDHVDYFVNKWVTAAEACGRKEGTELDSCYKTIAETVFSQGNEHTQWKDVHWDVVKAAKMEFFEESKKMKSAEEVQPLAVVLRARVVEAGVPEDHVDSMVNRWVEAAVKDFAQQAPGGATDTECAQYAGKGELAVRGCSKCAEHYPGLVDQCMTCGRICGGKVCDESTPFGDCVRTPPFIECHGACMTEGAISPDQHSYLKLLRLKRFFSAMYQKTWDLIEHYILF
jgi:hypothetical protein